MLEYLLDPAYAMEEYLLSALDSVAPTIRKNLKLWYFFSPFNVLLWCVLCHDIAAVARECIRKDSEDCSDEKIY